MIMKFTKSGYTCCYHYCEYFEQWVGWSTLNNRTYYCNTKEEAIDNLISDIDSYLMAF